MTPPELLVIRPSFAEPLPGRSLLALVHMQPPLLMVVEAPGMWEALGGQQPHRFLESGQEGRGRDGRGGAAIPLALAATELGEEAQAGNDLQMVHLT